MKKLFTLVVVAFTMLATSCSKDADVITPGEEVLVSFDINTPELATRAISDGTTASKLYFAVYDEDGKLLEDLSGEMEEEFIISTTLSFKLVDGMTYKFAFWAQNEDAPYDFDAEKAEVTVDYTNMKANQEIYDAFFAATGDIPIRGGMQMSVDLYRPFAQLNVVSIKDDTEAAAKSGITVAQTEVKVNAYKTLNLMDGTVKNPAVRTFAMNDIDILGTFGTEDTWLGMNYILVDYKELVEVTFTTKTDNNKVFEKKWVNIPVQRNYRTNIIGYVLTNDVDVNVEIMPDYEDDENNLRVTTVSTEAELVAAVNEGGLFNLQNDIVLSQILTIPAGKIVTLDLNNNTIEGTRIHQKNNFVNEGTLTIKNGVISSTGKNGGAALINRGTLVAENVILNGAPYDGTDLYDGVNSWWPSYAFNNEGGVATFTNSKFTSKHGTVASSGADALVTLNNCEINMAGIEGKTSHGIYAYSNGAVVINGGTYANNYANHGSVGGNILLVSGGTLTVNAGTFTGRLTGDAGLTLKGGTYSVDPSDYLADGYVATKSGDYYVVMPEATTWELEDGAVLDLKGAKYNGTIIVEGHITIKGDTEVKTITSTTGGTITIEDGKTLTLNNFSFGSGSNPGQTYKIEGGTVKANYGFFQHGTYELHSDFETGYMYYSFGSNITVYGTFHSQGKGDGLDYVRGNLTIAAGGKSIHDKTLWVGQPASWGAMSATLTIQPGGYVQANSLLVYAGSSLIYTNDADLNYNNTDIDQGGTITKL